MYGTGIACAIAHVYIRSHGTSLPMIAMVVFQALLMRQNLNLQRLHVMFQWENLPGKGKLKENWPAEAGSIILWALGIHHSDCGENLSDSPHLELTFQLLHRCLEGTVTDSDSRTEWSPERTDLWPSLNTGSFPIWAIYFPVLDSNSRCFFSYSGRNIPK